ncbi:MAG TPA: hypothetical protein ENH10_08910 [Bacteroidetes bacterium]|nr:hypothetical protein [Bacteroidota bacterium]HEX05254.1 hypothetical protein [Bacteroidota bacterium]
MIGEAELEREIQRRIAMASGSRPEDVAIEQRRVERDSVELAGYQLEFARLKSLYEAEGFSEAEFEAAETKLAELSTEFELSKARLAATQAGVRQEELKMQDAEVKRLSAEVDGLRESYGSSQEVRSPIDGVVSQKNDPYSLLVIQDMDTLAIRVVFPESFSAYLKSGMTVDVFFPSYPDQSIPVTLNQFGFYGGDTTATYGLGLVDNRELNLLPGMHGTAELPIGRITLVERIRNVMLIGQN